MAQENTFSQNKFSISTLGLLQESCEMQLKELGKIRIEGIFRGPFAQAVLQEVHGMPFLQLREAPL